MIFYMKYLILWIFFFSSIITADIDKAVKHLIENAEPTSTNWCAKYVSNALLKGGFKFTKQPYAYMYYTNGILIGIGYKEIEKPKTFQKGDITVIEKNKYHKYGHIAMYSGSQWISDFRQKNEFVYSKNPPPIHYFRYGEINSSESLPTQPSRIPQINDFYQKIKSRKKIPIPILKKFVIFTYAVRTSRGIILPEVQNDNDYAGKVGTAITDIAIKVNWGKLKYRVHIKGGKWLRFVSGYNWNDPENGYAGNGKPIDLVQIIHSEIEPKYKVSPINGKYYGWQIGDRKGDGYDGYAGSFGKTIDRIQIIPI